ncbi:MAG: DEAD/DEAH box helicase [Anaerolineae bacterium]|nr:DEAD/DEAH box helicase [Anaerolineae bacterium]
MNPRALLRELDFAREVAAWRQLPAAPARYAAFPATLHPRAIAVMQAQGIAQLYTHQAQALEAALAGQHVVITAGTAGGKSLVFHAATLDALLRDRQATALWLFPTKALGYDQRARFAAWLTAAALPADVCQTYDGDTDAPRRAEARRAARVILSNADMLHVGLLPNHPRWSAFFRALRYVVIDELHEYRGVFGSHVANVLRRLRRVCAFYGAAPTFILTSATLANPREHAEQLIESPVQWVNDDGSPRSERHIMIVNPPMVDAALGIRRSALLVARDLAAQLIRAGLQTVCFARTRAQVELLVRALREQLPEHRVVGYRAGYLPEERRAIEHSLRSGAIRGVVATNALELGVDIGALDACVMLGFPGSVASFWQQVGRVGRRGAPAIAIMVATADALDQFFAAQPEYLFAQPLEQARIAPDNLGVLAPHVLCAAFELPFVRGERLGRADVTALLDAFADEGLLHASGIAHLPLFRAQGAEVAAQPTTRYTWASLEPPAPQVSLRGVGARVRILAEDGTTLGETDHATAPLRVHPGAIYLHQGQTYRILALDLAKGEALARAEDVDYFTQAETIAEVVVLRSLLGDAPLGPVLAAVQVTTRVPRYRRVQFGTHRTLGWEALQLPPQAHETLGYWFALPSASAQALAREGVIGLPNDYGPNWAQQRDAARARDGYRCRVCGAPEPPGRQHHVHHLIPFRTFGYVRGENDAYLQANALDNLITVCPACHARIETAEAVNQALADVAYALIHLAPLLVMCEPADLGAAYDVRAPYASGLPALMIFEQAPGGIGLAEALMAQHATLLALALARVRDCPCAQGCPACIGAPSPALRAASRDRKRNALRVLQALRDAFRVATPASR